MSGKKKQMEGRCAKKMDVPTDKAGDLAAKMAEIQTGQSLGPEKEKQLREAVRQRGPGITVMELNAIIKQTCG